MEEELLSAIRSGRTCLVEASLSARHDLSLLVLKEHKKALESGLFSCVQGNKISFIRILVQHGRLYNSVNNLGRNVLNNVLVR